MMANATPQTNPVVAGREWLAVLGIAAIILAVINIPYMVGLAQQNAAWAFSGYLFGLDDANTYVAVMRQGANGAWLYQLTYTTEPHSPAFFYLFYLILGKVAAVFVPPTSNEFYAALVFTNHAARMVLNVGLILMMYRFIAAFLEKPQTRLVALMLVCLGGGLGWLLILTGNNNWLGTLPIDLYLPEGYSFYVLFGLPHIALARFSMLAGFLCLFAALRTGQLRFAWLASAWWLLMAIGVPFYVGVLYAVLGAWGLCLLAFQRGQFWPLVRFCVVGAVLPGLILAYLVVLYITEPVWRQFNSQNFLPSPHPLHYVLGYVFFALFAGIALPGYHGAAKADGQTHHWLLLGWLAIAPVLAYLPISIQRRLLEGVLMPLAILAAIGLAVVGKRFRLAAPMGVAFASLTSLTMIVFSTLAVSNPGQEDRLFYPRGANQLMNFLNSAAPAGQIVLTQEGESLLGNYLPARTNLRPYIGQTVETLNYAAKRETVSRFYAGQMTPAEAETFIRENGIAYVVASPGQTTPPYPWLVVLFEAEGYRAWQVALP
jgi:hypothetical protein